MTALRRTVILALAGVVCARGWAFAQTPPADTPEQLFAKDVHAKASLTCASCHTDPGPPAAIARTAIAPLCARCHSDAAYMQGFAKDSAKPRVDQFALYQTTAHGIQMAKGETQVATCSDCHRSHGVLPAADANSTVAPRNVATTCARCHSDAARMKAFGHYGDPPESWKKSVHAAALPHDSSAPTCSTCHSAHGVMREGAASLQMVCAECHVREADFYAKSPHKKAFDAMNQPGCLTCHSNHEIVAPSAALVGPEAPGICGTSPQGA